MRVTAVTKIRWLRMMNVKDCKKNYCECSDKLRRILLTKPTNIQHEKKINLQIEELEKKYNICFNNKY